MLYLAKILPIFVLPAGVIILLLVLSLALRRRALAVAALAVLWLSSTSLVGDALMRAAEGWQVRQPVASAPKAGAIVVLSGMLQSSDGFEGRDEWTDSVDRFEAGVALAKAGKAPWLVFTGGWLPWHPDARPEGEVLRERAIDRGIPPDRIAVTGSRSKHRGRVPRRCRAASAAGDGAGRTPSIVLVTSAYHMRRARLLFTRAGLSVTPFPVDFQTSAAPFSFLRLVPRAGTAASQHTETALREFYGYLYYRHRQDGLIHRPRLSSPRTGPRCAFTRARCPLASRRRTRAAFVGLVALRGLGRRNACRTSAASRTRASRGCGPGSCARGCRPG